MLFGHGFLRYLVYLQSVAHHTVIQEVAGLVHDQDKSVARMQERTVLCCLLEEGASVERIFGPIVTLS